MADRRAWESNRRCSRLRDRPVLLRPGMISRPEIEALIGPVETLEQCVNGSHPSPGMHRKHYSPRTPLLLVEDGGLPAQGRGAYLWFQTSLQAAKSVRMPDSAHAYASRLYTVLHEVDEQGWDWIAVERPPAGSEWAAIHDRLERAACR